MNHNEFDWENAIESFGEEYEYLFDGIAEEGLIQGVKNLNERMRQLQAQYKTDLSKFIADSSKIATNCARKPEYEGVLKYKTTYDAGRKMMSGQTIIAFKAVDAESKKIIKKCLRDALRTIRRSPEYKNFHKKYTKIDVKTRLHFGREGDIYFLYTASVKITPSIS